MELDLTPRELLTTTRTVRKRLDLVKPVPRDVVEGCLRLAWQAPNGGNRQQFNWVLVDDAATRAEMGHIYSECLDAIMAQANFGPDGVPISDRPSDRTAKVWESTVYLKDHIHEVPVLVIPTIDGRAETLTTAARQSGLWGSIMPAMSFLMLALRSQGMGTAWTNIHLNREQEMAELLGIPYDEVTQAGLLPVAYTIGTDFRPAARDIAEQTVHWNRW